MRHFAGAVVKPRIVQPYICLHKVRWGARHRARHRQQLGCQLRNRPAEKVKEAVQSLSSAYASLTTAASCHAVVPQFAIHVRELAGSILLLVQEATSTSSITTDVFWR